MPWIAFAYMSTMMYLVCTSAAFWVGAPAYPIRRPVTGNPLERGEDRVNVPNGMVFPRLGRAAGVALLRNEPLLEDFLRRHPADELLGGVLVLGVFHDQIGERARQIELAACTAGNAGVKDVVLHRRALLSQVRVGLLLRLKIDRGTVIGCADAAGEKGAVVAGVVPGEPALVHRLFPQCDGELHQFNGLLGVEHNGFAVGLDLLAAPGPQVWIPPARRVAEGVASGLAIGLASGLQLLADGAVFVPRLGKFGAPASASQDLR